MHRLGALEGGGGYSPPPPMHLCPSKGGRVSEWEGAREGRSEWRRSAGTCPMFWAAASSFQVPRGISGRNPL